MILSAVLVYKKFWFVVCLLLSLVAIGVVSTKPAAALHEFPVNRSNTFPNPDASSQPLYMTIGRGAFDSELTGVVMLLPAVGNYTITIEDATFCNDDSFYGGRESPDLPDDDFGWTEGGFDTGFLVVGPGDPGPSGRNFYPPDTNDLRGGLTTDTQVRCGAASTRTLPFAVQASDRRDSVGGKYIVFFAAIIAGINSNSTASAQENSFRISVNGGGEISSMSNFMNLSNRSRNPVGSETSEIVVDFATRCNSSIIQATPRLYDLDTGTTVQPNDVYVELHRYDRTPPHALLQTMLPPTRITGGNNVEVPIPGGPYNFSPDYLYRAKVTGIYHRNALTYIMGTNPNNLAELFANDFCPPPDPVYTCTATVSPSGPFGIGERFQVRVNINAAGSDPNSSTMNNSTHPISISSSPGGIQGIGPASEHSYSINPPGNYEDIAIDQNVYSNTPAEYTLNVRVKDVNCPTSALVIGNKSYMKIYGGEVMAGGVIGGSGACTPAVGRGGIHAWAEGSGTDYKGASSQLTVSALLEINEFFSVSLRSPGNAVPPKGLTFANDDGSLPWGGEYASGRCVTDYYNDTQDETLNVGPWGGSTAATLTPGRHQYATSPSATIANSGGLTIPAGVQAAVYVDGDVHIRNNIIFGPAGATWETAPNFALIVRGSIWINRNVTRLDGLYIAQTGTIYTCVNNVNNNFTPATIFANCQNQLSINGGLIARDVKFQRLRGSVLNAGVRERPIFADGSCDSPTCFAAEVINYTPQVWLAPSGMKRPGEPDGGTPTTNAGPYDAIKEMPPIY
ncbi:MAG: hypothetical protein M3Q14_02865 [bacterium]|nr:hypothetical protein [bacterium]